MATRQEVIDYLATKKLPFSDISINNMKEAMLRGTMNPDEAMQAIGQAEQAQAGQAPPAPEMISMYGQGTYGKQLETIYNGESAPTPIQGMPAPSAPAPGTEVATIKLPDGRTATLRGTREQIRAASREIMAQFQPKATNKTPEGIPAFTPEEAQQAALGLTQMIATNPTGAPRAPRTTVIPTNPYQVGYMAEPASDDPDKLANQSREAGVDIHTGMDQRFALGLAEFKDPWLQSVIVDKYARDKIASSGIQVDPRLPVSFVDENTGRLSFLRPITEDDIRGGDDPRNEGKLRRTLVNPVGADLGDLAEYMPAVGTAGAEMATGVALASMSGMTGGLALTSSAAASGAINALGVELRDKLLRDMYGIPQEQIDKSGNPNEALIQAAWASGGEMGVGALISGIRAVKNKRRFLTESSYDEIVAANGEIMQTFDEFQRVTGMQLGPPPGMVAGASGVRAASNATDATAAELSMRVPTLLRRLNPIAANRAAAQDLDTHLKVATGFQQLTNRTVEATDPQNLIALDRQRGVITPEDGFDSANRALSTRQQLQDTSGVTRARRTAEQAMAEEQKALDTVNSRSNPQLFVDTQNLTQATVKQAQADQTTAWDNFRSIVEVDSKGKSGIVLSNPSNRSPIHVALNQIGREAEANLSTALGKKSEKFVEDLAALRAGELDINSLHRLQSQLKYELRSAQNSNNLGYTAHDIGQVLDAIDTQIEKGDWVRTGTGRSVPAVKARGLEALSVAQDATLYYKSVAEKDTIRNLTEVEPSFREVDGVQRRDGYRFKEMPGSVRDKLFSDAEAMRDVLTVTGDNPQVRAGMANELEAIFLRDVTHNGEFKMGAYQEFRRKYGDHMDLLFGEENAAKIRNVETMHAARMQADQTAAEVDTIFKQTFGDIYDSNGRMAPDHLINEAMSSKNIDANQLGNTFRRLDRVDPRLAKNMRAEMAQWLADKTMSGSRLKDSNAIWQMLNDHESKIGAVMGAQYVKDMRVVGRTLDIMGDAAEARTLKDPVQGPYMQVARTVMGVMNPWQRRLTAFNRFSRSRGARKTLEIMSDPQRLRDFVRLKNMDPRSLVARSIIGRLGLEQAFAEAGVTTEPRENDMKAPGFEDFRQFAEGQAQQ